MQHIQHRAIVYLLQALTTLLFAVLFLMCIKEGPVINRATVAAASLSMLSLTWLYQRGWDHARYIVVIIITALGIIGLPSDVQYMAIIIPVLMASALANRYWTIASAVTLYAGLLIRSGFQGQYMQASIMIMFVAIVCTILIERHFLDLTINLARRANQLDAMRATTRAFAHQINQPLTAALGYLQLYQYVATPTADDAELANLKHELERIAVLVRQFNAVQEFTTEPYVDGKPILSLPSESDKQIILYH